MLNAFRHHCCHHAQSSPCSAVSNWCAQRLSASLLSSPLPLDRSIASLRVCSTPFGITAVITITPSRSSMSRGCAQRLSASLLSSRKPSRSNLLGCRVLNAFRHHCCHHSTANVARTFAGVCSTPFGITAVITMPRTAWRPGTTCAQRLSASLLSSQPCDVEVTTIGVGAQRLSASLLSSQLVERK